VIGLLTHLAVPPTRSIYPTTSRPVRVR
jgi:hypothetical protein